MTARRRDQSALPYTRAPTADQAQAWSLLSQVMTSAASGEAELFRAAVLRVDRESKAMQIAVMVGATFLLRRCLQEVTGEPRPADEVLRVLAERSYDQSGLLTEAVRDDVGRVFVTAFTADFSEVSGTKMLIVAGGTLPLLVGNVYAFLARAAPDALRMYEGFDPRQGS